MRLLCLSNGHGEDAIATRILRRLMERTNPPQVAALPLVGEGLAYTQLGIPLIGPVKSMPSGGFIYGSGEQFARDVQAGMLQLLWHQYQAMRTWAKEGGVVLAVGDILPLLLAWLSSLKYGFVGTAKSEYWIRDEQGPLPGTFGGGWSGSVYLPWERWLMASRRCVGVFPRDRLTAVTLKERSLPVFDLGNPMMDDLLPIGNPTMGEDRALTFVLLPGSRGPESYENWEVLLKAASALLMPSQSFASLQRPMTFLGAIAPGLSLETFGQLLETYGWQRQSASAEPSYTLHKGTMILSQTAYSQYLQTADFALAMAGTATEQFVGLGKPAIAIPGKGPQFTLTFAQVQAKLLGPSLILVDTPAAVPLTLHSLMQDPDRLQLIYANGRRRMGEPGASERIAQCLQEKFF